MKIIITLCLIILSYTINAQKKTITKDTYLSWTTVSGGGLSNNGKFAYYTINNEPKGENTFVITSTENNWSRKFKNIVNPLFSEDSKQLYGQLMGDTLLKVDLGLSKIQKIPNVLNYKLCESKKNQFLVLYLTDRILMIQPTNSEAKLEFRNVEEYEISANGHAVIIKEGSNDTHNTVKWIDITTGRSKTIYSGTNVNNLFISKDGKNCGFHRVDVNGVEIWTCNYGSEVALMILDEKSTHLGEGMKLSALSNRFTNDGKYIFVTLKKSEKAELEAEPKTNFNLWNYQDAILRSVYYNENGKIKISPEAIAIVNIETKSIRQLTEKNEKIPYNFNNKFDSLIVLEKSFGNPNEIITASKIDYTLCNIRSGERKKIVTGKNKPLQNIKISPRNSFVSYYDPEENQYFSYNIKNDTLLNISANANENFSRCILKGYPDTAAVAAGMIGWNSDEENIVVNGEFDIWRLDPRGKKSPENLTAGYGRKNQTVFNMAMDLNDAPLNWNTELELTMFDLRSKDIGFTKLHYSKKTKLSNFRMEPYYLYPMENIYFQIVPDQFIKAKNSNSYLVLKQKSNNAPNYYFTNDLQNFRPISEVQPQIEYNWLYSELHTYKDSLGNTYQGILYKPENFDSTKKYPILFNYYTEKSNLLNCFPKLEPAHVDFNIPMAISQGYIVFLPDMVSKIGYAGDGALKSILSAVTHLSLYSWADTSRMGIAGHSFGGFETNYIVTHCDKFKAAISGAGVSEYVSMPYEVWGGSGYSKEDYYKNLVPKMGVSLLKNPEVYIRNSPLLYANSTSTPLLLLHNFEDKSVPYRQSRQFFLALRSLNKRAWWINYKNEGHGLSEIENRIDFEDKVFGFFNYYLRDMAKPKWMDDSIAPERP